ncbi:hypothetical protein IV38_GL000966 [Lactobacillus selangorensis]|uniref:Integron-associated effector binding protein domain-containing protein n=1 Tax=Lactobacillus selangorensis TaxID=81857 RepID=A0A0R2G883_9LACO|nr:effector binding domain-containing protein [Lactobacillus selangorensis]KRN28761.1 hypothetical protein IV38_GL000966 [Lactobacillus selangorensis]KRN32829.1 hypothetical protein IV40_GL000887 [Lactobacillus selangorensis]
MADYRIEKKDAFTVVGFEKDLSGDYSLMPQQKADFWQQATGDPAFEKLAQKAVNDYEFAVNEATPDGARYYVGRQVAAPVQADWAHIHFDAGNYLVIDGTGATATELFSNLEKTAFGDVLKNLTDYQYVGGPNTTILQGHKGTQAMGEIWIPVTAQA